MNQDAKTETNQKVRQRHRRCFHCDRVDLKTAEIHWRLNTPAPDSEALKLNAKDRVFVLDRQTQPYRKDNRESNPIRRLPEFTRAKEMILKAVQERSRVIIYGDFDCDGVTSITLMRDLLLACKLPERRLKCVMPQRLTFGYGLHWDCIRPIVSEMGAVGEQLGLVIVVDCGSSHLAQVRKILAEGISVLVIDHHEPARNFIGFEHPEFVHLNPKLAAEGSVIKDLCAAGLVYLFAAEIGHGNSAWDEERARLLAGMATCVDVVPLHGVNRWLLKESVRLANQPEILKRVPGLYWLAKRPRALGTERLPKEVYFAVDEHTYGFEWGPCLNAAGRMSTAETALSVLLATAGDDEENLFRHIEWCKEMNQWRRATNLAIEEWALAEAERKIRLFRPSVLFISNATWHPGVVGIVASRLKEKFHRPAIVCTKSADGKWRGSGRSIKNINAMPFHMGDKFLAAAVENKILHGGGHQMAGGLALARHQLRPFEKWIEANSGLTQEQLIPKVETYASASVLSPKEWWEMFETLRPFGSGNPCPPLIVPRAELKKIRTRTRLDREFYRTKTLTADAAESDNNGSEADDGRDESPRRPTSGAMSLLERIRTAKPRPEVWAYEGTFLDLDTGKIFFAHWMDLDQAEKLWGVKKFMRFKNPNQWSFKWPQHFKLELQLQSYISASHRAALKQGRLPAWEHNFRILQCLPTPKHSGRSAGKI